MKKSFVLVLLMAIWIWVLPNQSYADTTEIQQAQRKAQRLSKYRWKVVSRIIVWRPNLYEGIDKEFAIKLTLRDADMVIDRPLRDDDFTFLIFTDRHQFFSKIYQQVKAGDVLIFQYSKRNLGPSTQKTMAESYLIPNLLPKK